MWPFSGYNEIQTPRKKNVLIDHDRLQGLFEANSYDQLRDSHRGWVEKYLENGTIGREAEKDDIVPENTCLWDINGGSGVGLA